MTSRSRRVAVFPGSFDPVTRGHLDVIARAAQLFDRVVVGVLDNPEKSSLLPASERLSLLSAEIEGLEGVSARTFSGLTVDFAAATGADWILRGLRSSADAGYELPMAHTNRLCGPAPVETIFIPTRPEFAFISSTLVRQIAAEGGTIAPLVTAPVERALRAVFGA